MWLLKTEVLGELRALVRGGASADDRRAFEAHCAAEAAQPLGTRPMYGAAAVRVASLPRNMTVAGNVAQISVEGLLTEKPDFWAWLLGMGNTTYASIVTALAAADADPNIKEIVLQVNSPGGSVAGLFETLAAISATKKPMRSRASLAASAAFAIVAAAGPIEATTFASEFGSIGVAASIFLDEQTIDIASTEAPNKRPDVTTPEGVAVIREELDALHALFAQEIAMGRKATTGDEEMTVARVNADFGRGSVLLAKDAKKRGMIDSLPKSTARARGKNASAGIGGPETPEPVKVEGKVAMTKDELKAQHPELYASIREEGREEGIKAGTDTERKRVKAHNAMAKAAGDPSLAVPFIESGASVQDDEVFATYQTASMNRNAQAARQTDSDTALAAVAGATPPTTTAGAGAASAAGTEVRDMGDEVADRIAAKSGKVPAKK